jgi:hypothetical protein
LVASIVAGIITTFTVARLLDNCAPALANQYMTVFGLSHCIASTLSPPDVDRTHGEFYGAHGELIFLLVTWGFWTVLFGFVYFRFVFRGSKRSNQALERTADRREE